MNNEYITDIGADVLMDREGEKLTAYKDSVGVWTIGVGHTGPDVTPGMLISAARSRELFFEDVAKHAARPLAAIKVPLADHQRDALVSIAFNIGVTGFINSTFVKRINAGASPKQIADAIMKWKIPAAIIGRRRAEVNQFFTPYDVANPSQTATKLVPASQVGGAAKPGPAATAPAKEKVYAEDLLPAFEIEAIQRRMIELGWHQVGIPNGVWGPSTDAAAMALQQQARQKDPSIIADGHYGPQTKALLADKANRREISQTRAETTEKDLADAGMPTVVQSRRIQWSSVMSFGATVLSVLMLAFQNYQAGSGSVSELPFFLQAALNFAPPWVTMTVPAVLALYNAAVAKGIIGSQVEGVREGIINSARTPTSEIGLGGIFGGLFGRKS